ncbi:transposase [Novosphingobium sp. KA1]|uniref:IS66-like element accessory protein TnpA n=1 Tax=Novosphingobium sp. (strain KA1) TaxID=164608 RepID=UPI00351C1C71
MRVEILGQERRRRWTDQQRLEIIGAVGVNGATLTEVAQRHDVTRQQIYTWRYDLKKRGLLGAAPEPVFLPLDLPAVRAPEVAYDPGPDATSMVELRLTKGRTLRFGSDIEVISLARLIRCVEAA